MNVTDNEGRSHRTALFIDARDLSQPYGERAQRLLQSVNGAGIKADVFSVRPGGAGGVVRISGSPESLAVTNGEAVDFDANDLSEWARDQGYDLVVIAFPPGSEVA